jgi:hypothetical protein
MYTQATPFVQQQQTGRAQLSGTSCITNSSALPRPETAIALGLGDPSKLQQLLLLLLAPPPLLLLREQR